MVRKKQKKFPTPPAEDFSKWVLTKYHLKSPEGDIYTPKDIRLIFWQRQMWSIMKQRINFGHQMDLFENKKNRIRW